MIKVKDLILAVGILSFFLITDERQNRNNDNTEASIETPQFDAFPADTLIYDLDVYDSYADFTY